MWKLTWVPRMKFKLPHYTWDKDRRLCEQCKNIRQRGTQMWCTVGGNRNGSGMNSCIDTRGLTGRCGPEGKLFERG